MTTDPDPRDVEEINRHLDAKHKIPAKKPKPPPTPPPPPNPGSRYKNQPWLVKNVHYSHGLRKVVDGGEDDGLWTIEEFVNRCLTYGVKAVCGQLGADCPDPAWAKHIIQLRDALTPHGIPTFGWSRADYAPWETVKADIRSVMPLAGYLADVEGPCNDPDLPEHLAGEFAGEMPLGVISTGGIDEAFPNMTPGQVAARFGDYFDFVGQDYAKAGTPLETDPCGEMENFVYWRGTDKNAGKGFRKLATGKWHLPVYMPNAEGCPPLSAYKPWHEAFGGPFGVWDAELLDKGQFELGTGCWDVFASITG